MDNRVLGVPVWALPLVVPTPSIASAPAGTYAYHSQNRLIGYTSPTTEATYAYDALDRRIAKTVDGVTEAFVCDRTAADPLAHGAITPKFTDDILTQRCEPGDSARRPLRYHPGDHA